MLMGFRKQRGRMGNVESNELRRTVLIRQVLVASALAIVSAFANTELGHGFWSAETMVIAFAELGSLAVFLVMLVVHLAKRRWIAARGYGLLLVAFVASMRVAGHIGEHHERTAKQAAQPILRALDAYKADAGRYPQSLEELVPGLLPSIGEAPVAFIRTLPYGYRPSDDGASYSLSFPEPHGYWHYFDSQAGQWGMHD